MGTLSVNDSGDRLRAKYPSFEQFDIAVYASFAGWIVGAESTSIIRQESNCNGRIHLPAHYENVFEYERTRLSNILIWKM